MSEVLSQNEIDNLLQALSSGELDVEEMKDNGLKQLPILSFQMHFLIRWFLVLLIFLH